MLEASETMRDAMTTLSAARLLYLTHLAERIRAYETGELRIDATAYRLFSRRLREATLGSPDRRLSGELGSAYPEVTEVLEARYFEAHGRLGQGDEARLVERRATDWLKGLMAL